MESTVRRRAAVLAIILTAAAAAAAADAGRCGEPPAPAIGAPAVPVVLVPGITGSSLRHRQTGELVWGTGRLLVGPKDGGYALVLPIPGSTAVAGAPDRPRLEVSAVIEEMRLAGIIRQQVYGPILEMFEARGYRRGDLEAPRAGDTAFAFAYDWRLSNVDSARRLAERLEALRQVRAVGPAGTLEVDLVCQSNGAHICRYLTKYGGAPLAEAEAGGAGPLPWLRVRRLILLGAANGGGMRILRELDRGRNYISLVGRKWYPETLFSFPSIFQDLPVYRRDLFLDADGRELALDLFDAETWRRQGWSIFGPAARRRLLKHPRPDLFADEERQLAFLARALDEARRFHRLLAADVEGFTAGRYHLVRSSAKDTPERAVLLPRGERRHLAFTGDRELERRGALHARATSPGDGHATVASQLWLSPQEKAVLGPPVDIDSRHFEIVLERRTLDCVAALLGEEMPSAVRPVPVPAR